MPGAPARKPILKRTAPCAQDFCPKPVDKQMEVESPYDPPVLATYADLSGRKTSIEEYKQREEGVDYPIKKARYTFSPSEVLHFNLLESTISNPVCIEPVKGEDPLGPFAARALDRLICNREFAVRIGRPLTYNVEAILNSELEKYNTFTNETKTTEEIKAVTLEQAQDLLERCEQRLVAMPPTAQINVSAVRKQAIQKWSEEEEADYHEKLLTRVPDVLTQCFLTKRVLIKVSGLDANANTQRILRDSIIPSLMG
jgi:hypothetical protein